MDDLQPNTFYSGTSGLVLPVANKSHYPAEFQTKTRLTYYASLFNSIEVNSSFYKVPQAKTVGKWATEVGDDFKFTFKLWKGITHNKEMAFDPEDVHRFMHAIDAAGDKKGSLLVQFPPGARVNLFPQLRNLVHHIKQADPYSTWQIAMEFRHALWYREDVVDFIEDSGMAIVIQDIPASQTPMSYATANFVYLRFHGPGGSYRGSYPDDVLQEYTSYIQEWRDDGKTVYVYFNNTIGDAVKNLATLNNIVSLG